jgi:hypothetical protein
VSTTVEVAGAVSLAGTAAAIGVLAYLHVAPTGLSPVRNPVSQYGISTYRWGYRAVTISMGVAGAALGIALHGAVHGSGVAAILALVAIFSVSRLAISWFPMDVPGTERTTTGAVHGLLAIATFGSVAAAAVRLYRVLEVDSAWKTLAGVSRGLGWAMVACLVVLMLSRLAQEVRRAFGAVERALYVGILAWLIVIGVACATGQL